MKVREKKRKNDVFEPFTLEVKIQTEKELCDLWERLNISQFDIRNPRTIHGAGFKESSILWDVLDEKAEEFKLLKDK